MLTTCQTPFGCLVKNPPDRKDCQVQRNVLGNMKLCLGLEQEGVWNLVFAEDPNGNVGFLKETCSRMQGQLRAVSFCTVIKMLSSSL